MRHLDRRALGVPLLAVVIGASSVAAQEDATPSPSATSDASPGPSIPAQAEPLGGAWRRIAAAPFGALDVPGGWTGTELVLVDPKRKRRATSYLPALDRWDPVARPPRKLAAGSETHWIGSELVFVEPRGAARRGLAMYDPVSDTWRSSAVAPFNEISSSVFAGDVLVVLSGSADRLAIYRPATDSWSELAPPEGSGPVSLHSTGEAVLALVRPADAGGLAFVSLDAEREEWAEPRVGPLTEDSAEPLWVGDAFISTVAQAEVTEAAEGAEGMADSASVAVAERAPGTEAVAGSSSVPTVGVRYDPATGQWTEFDVACALDTTDAVWDGSLILDVDELVGVDPRTGQCYTLPASRWPARRGALRVWTGNAVLEVGGDTGGAKPRRDGVAYDPYPGDDPLGVALDKGSRPVRVRVPSLGIDLPVVWDGRRVRGATPGYPACDVALTWSVFGLPGEPGVAWILAHAQRGMFLPLLETFVAGGKEDLLGREVEVQLRDGRLLTYRTYRVNPRATNTNIGTKGLKKDEHRLVLQTSTGVGSAPKLLVAARLVDVGTTDEPRPKPNPRACG